MSMNSALSSDLSAGSVFAGRYRVERLIAAGGMGAVYEVVHIETNRRRALKVMHAQYVSNDVLREKFRQEARVAAEIESEHIVDVFDAGVDDATGMPFLVMELLRGEDLRTRLKRAGALPKEEALRYLFESSLALDKTHRARIVHRDLKPDNLFLCERAHGPPLIKVLDFGIAKLVLEASAQANATSSLGTPLYMAPEQFVLKGTISPATDVFALGLIAFTLLVGKPYWYPESTSGSGMLAFAMHAATGPRDSAVARARHQFGVELPSGFDTWFFRATAREPTARFASAGDAVRALADVFGLPMPLPGAPAHRGTMPSVNMLELPALTPLPAANGSVSSGTSSTAPTPLAMTPMLEEPTLGKRSPSSRSLVLVAMAGTLTLGLTILLVVKGFVSESSDNPSQTTKAPPAAALVTSSNIPSIQPVANLPVVEPLTSSSAIASSSGRTDLPSRVTVPVSSLALTTPVATAAPPVTAKTPSVKSGSRGTWEAD